MISQCLSTSFESTKATMELLEAVETQPLAKIEALIQPKYISDDIKRRALMRAFAYERKDVIRFLLGKHCSVKTELKTYAFTTTPLHCAIKLRDIDLVKEILQKNPSVIKADSDGNTPLHLAFLHRYEEAVDLILTHIERKSKYTNQKNRNGLTHMHIACTRRNTNVIHGFLIEKVNLEDAVSESSPYWPGYTALHFAVDFGSLDAFKILDGFEIPDHLFTDNNKRPWQLIQGHLEDLLVMSYLLGFKNEDENNESKPYFLLACLRKNPCLLKKFTDLEANVNYAMYLPSLNPYKNTALHVAVESNNIATVELLLMHGADLKAKNDHSMTALHLAFYKDCSQKSEIVNLLYKAVDMKDSANVEDENGLGYFHVAVTRNDLHTVEKFLRKGVDVNKLIKPNPNQFSHFTALHFAVLYQHADMARLLIRHGANVDSVGKENPSGTPLHLAFEVGHRDSIEVLLENGADATLIRADGKTPLHLLVSHFVKQCDDPKQSLLSSDKQAILMYVEQLIRLGVDVNAQDKNGRTALHELQLDDNECAPCFQLLLELGADVNLEDEIKDLPLDLLYYLEDRCNSAEYLMFYHHVQKLKTLGSYVHPENNELCETILKDLNKLEPNARGFRNEELTCRQQQRLDEVEKLKNIMITPFMSLYHFVKLEPKRAATYVPNEVLEKILAREDFDKTYPSYGYLIRLRYKRNMNCFRVKDFGEKVVSSEADEDSPASKRQRLT